MNLSRKYENDIFLLFEIDSNLFLNCSLCITGFLGFMCKFVSVAQGIIIKLEAMIIGVNVNNSKCTSRSILVQNARQDPPSLFKFFRSICCSPLRNRKWNFHLVILVRQTARGTMPRKNIESSWTTVIKVVMHFQCQRSRHWYQSESSIEQLTIFLNSYRHIAIEIKQMSA